MTKLEQLKSEYSRIKKDLEFYQNHERETHKNAEDCEKKMKIIEEKIKEIEDNGKKNKLLDCVDFISRYCRGQETCYHCMFYDENGCTRCMLKNAMNPAIWNDKLER